MEDISVIELRQRLDNREEIFIIDVREPFEYEQTNMNGLNIPMGELQLKLPDLEEHRDKEIVIHCRTGGRSAAAKNFMVKKGFLRTRSLLGGIEAWNNEIKQ